MEQIYPELEERLLEMSEGDADFKMQLTVAIYQGLLELKEIYTEGSAEKDEDKIQQIRHKLKPTLSIFVLTPIINELQEGKEIIETEGFEGVAYESHYQRFQEILTIAIARVFELTK